MKKSLWHRLLKQKRRPKKKAKTALAVSTGPKKHKTRPDQWKPPFAVKERSYFRDKKQNLTVVNEPSVFDLGKVTATVGVMLQAEMDYAFKFFVNDCLERFRNFDWGGVNENEGRTNDRRIMTRTGTVYGIYTDLESGIQIWIASDLDQGLTRIRLSDER